MSEQAAPTVRQKAEALIAEMENLSAKADGDFWESLELLGDTDRAMKMDAYRDGCIAAIAVIKRVFAEELQRPAGWSLGDA